MINVIIPISSLFLPPLSHFTRKDASEVAHPNIETHIMCLHSRWLVSLDNPTMCCITNAVLKINNIKAFFSFNAMQLNYASIHCFTFVAFINCSLFINNIRYGAFISPNLHYLPGHSKPSLYLRLKCVKKRFKYSCNTSALS